MTAETKHEWPLPGEAAALRFAATVKVHGSTVIDCLEHPSDLEDWLDAVGLDRAGKSASQMDLNAARLLRDAIRQTFAHWTRDTRPMAATGMDVIHAVEHINSVAAQAPSQRLIVANDQVRVMDETGSPIRAALGRVAEGAIKIAGDDRHEQLRACYAPGCLHYFLGTHQGREWCSTTCGNRVRAARHYRRSRTRAGRTVVSRSSSDTLG